MKGSNIHKCYFPTVNEAIENEIDLIVTWIQNIVKISRKQQTKGNLD